MTSAFTIYEFHDVPGAHSEQFRDAAVAVSEALALVRRMPPTATPDEFGQWHARAQYAVHCVSRAAPYGRATRPIIDLFTLLFRPPVPVEAGTTGAQTLDVARYRDALQDGLLRVNERMSAGPTTDLSEALRIVLDAFACRQAQEVADLLGVRAPAVRRLRQGRVARVPEERVLAVAELVEELTFAEEASRLGQWCWFWATNERLGGQRPVDLLEDDPSGGRQQLVQAVRNRHSRLDSAA